MAALFLGCLEGSSNDCTELPDIEGIMNAIVTREHQQNGERRSVRYVVEYHVEYTSVHSVGMSIDDLEKS